MMLRKKEGHSCVPSQINTRRETLHRETTLTSFFQRIRRILWACEAAGAKRLERASANRGR